MLNGANDGGWNGGGPIVHCKGGHHSSSGAGMTHASFTNNPAVSKWISQGSWNKYAKKLVQSTAGNHQASWNPEGTIAVAGGSGGAGYDRSGNGGYSGGLTAGTALTNYLKNGGKVPSGGTQTSGFMQGVGESGTNSAGGGGGWWGGRSIGSATSWGCTHGGGGGSSYISDSSKNNNMVVNNRICRGDDPSTPKNPCLM